MFQSTDDHLINHITVGSTNHFMPHKHRNDPTETNWGQLCVVPSGWLFVTLIPFACALPFIELLTQCPLVRSSVHRRSNPIHPSDIRLRSLCVVDDAIFPPEASDRNSRVTTPDASAVYLKPRLAGDPFSSRGTLANPNPLCKSSIIIGSTVGN